MQETACSRETVSLTLALVLHVHGVPGIGTRARSASVDQANQRIRGSQILLMKPKHFIVTDVTPEFDYESAREFLASKERRRQALLDARFQRAWEDFRRISKMIQEKYAPRAIYQWGSLLDLGHFSEISDIDIALEGPMTPERFFALLNEAESMTDLPLDIVELEKIHPAHAAGIRSRGRLVYGRE